MSNPEWTILVANQINGLWRRYVEHGEPVPDCSTVARLIAQAARRSVPGDRVKAIARAAVRVPKDNKRCPSRKGYRRIRQTMRPR